MSVHDREDALVARLHRLAPGLDGEPDPDFQARTRARLVAMAAVRTPEPAAASGLQRVLAVRAPDVAPSRWRARFTAGLAGAAMTVTALAGLVAVADGARPGDVLYDLKRGTEQTQLALAGDSRGQTLLEFARTRLDEVADLVGEGRPAGGAEPALVVETLRAMDEHTADGAAWLTRQAVDSAGAQPLDRLARWAAGQAGELTALQPLVPEEAADAVGRSMALLAQIGTRTDGLQTALLCPAGPSVAGSDALGPVPAPCPAPEPAPPAPPGTAEEGGATPGAVPEAPAPENTPPPAATPAPSPPAEGGVPTPGAPAPAPTTPRVPTLPLPTLPVGGGGGGGQSTPPPIIKLPPLGPIEVCAPPLVTIGCGP
ncbi:DUF5667 domain-containing protein [Blastococcus tunisiensis]|uniref:DUF5667 domain-containing protein n=1 Tax=Blastococcus tunisiensis TaxID=1798228 RepID=A0A1I1VTS2_9ACTN|nr:DUF5667 domain-containing protein [Blastococcus sp. DSM 46838]SFD86447.1 hypothetical protein SAMN05216574_101106 [Blastococcus sp. DSM 46838]